MIDGNPLELTEVRLLRAMEKDLQRCLIHNNYTTRETCLEQKREEHRRIFEQRREARLKGEEVAKRQQVSQEERGDMLECRECHSLFPRPQTRGRPPVRCEQCRLS